MTDAMRLCFCALFSFFQKLNKNGIMSKRGIYGHEIGRQGMKDEEIIPLLHKLHRATFFTRDLGFYKRHLLHPNYCLVRVIV